MRLGFLLNMLLLCCGIAQAAPAVIKPFTADSYQQILQSHARQPFVLSIWSVNCPSCLKDMKTLTELRQKHPDLRLIMLSTDESDALPELQAILDRHGLNDIEQWLFADGDADQLRHSIDPSWYGELPRTYVFDAAHNRTGKSGALNLQAFEALLR